MPVAIEPEQIQAPPEIHTERKLYRSGARAIGGVCGGLGEYFAIDPVWFRIGFVVLALGGGSGILIYLLMWLLVPPAPVGYTAPSGGRPAVSGAAVIGIVLVIVGTIALVNTIAPSMGQYVWPAVLVVGGLALILGGLNRDNN